MMEHMDLELEATDRIDVRPIAAIGYQKPDLRRVVDNDPDVAGLILLMDFTEHTDDEVGHALGSRQQFADSTDA